MKKGEKERYVLFIPHVLLSNFIKFKKEMNE